MIKRPENNMREVILPHYTEDLGGLTVELRNSVRKIMRDDCDTEDYEIEIPDLRGLVRAAAFARALNPVRLSGAEVKFMRRALDMKQREFAEAMELAPETVSRWESDATGIGGMSEKSLRQNVCALLQEIMPSLHYMPADLTRMEFRPAEPNAPVMVFERVVVKRGSHSKERVWDEFLEAA